MGEPMARVFTYVALAVLIGTGEYASAEQWRVFPGKTAYVDIDFDSVTSPSPNVRIYNLVIRPFDIRRTELGAQFDRITGVGEMDCDRRQWRMIQSARWNGAQLVDTKGAGQPWVQIGADFAPMTSLCRSPSQNAPDTGAPRSEGK
jgi:hypothetical protein